MALKVLIKVEAVEACLGGAWLCAPGPHGGAALCLLSFLHGKAGVHAVAAVNAYMAEGKRPCKMHVDRVLALQKLALEGDVADSLMYGRAGVC